MQQQQEMQNVAGSIAMDVDRSHDDQFHAIYTFFYHQILLSLFVFFQGKEMKFPYFL